MIIVALNPAAAGDQSPLISSAGSGSSRFIMHSSAEAEETADELSTDEVEIIFSFLSPYDIMRARVCTTWREAAKKTLVPLTTLAVASARSYNAMRAMSTALPNLKQIFLCHIVRRHKYEDGEDPDPDEEGAARTANYTHTMSISYPDLESCVN